MLQHSVTQRKSQINIVLNHAEEKLEAADSALAEAVRKHIPLERIQKEMEQLIGLQEVKHLLKEVYAWLFVNQCRQENGLRQNSQALHMMFKGNPGTGKTTVARLLGTLFLEMNVLSKGHLIEVERADLVGEYIGHTAQKTRELVKKAKGGILFIDEAYSLARGGEKDFGKEAIDTLVKAMEDYHEDFILILAGYSEEMDNFLSLNPGLPSRFPLMIDFPDYSNDELLEIARKMISERQYRFSREAEWKLKKSFIMKRIDETGSFSNGRFVRNIIEKAIRKQAVRLLGADVIDRTSLELILPEDIPIED
ncbi:stage V sporulation protein K [Guptibacillus algicola]|uniref:stage V sporulation protein K n=1 Tax=Guptibacillus algicola TaxID=225844 RepID=UPI001CD67848|nr:stage V sporulation protein K [Alkalihalobacillus algicola]MCA0988132.1 stage V sporulation protein K [Alkalihalobacillus algicola]